MLKIAMGLGLGIMLAAARPELMLCLTQMTLPLAVLAGVEKLIRRYA